MKEIVNRILETWQSHGTAMLVSIISRGGSTPRGVGAQMLVGKNGLITGTIGGGLIEKTAIDRSVEALNSKKSFTEYFELTLSNNKMKMACGGSLNLHFLYMDEGKFKAPIEEINRKINSDEHGFMVIDTVNNTIECRDNKSEEDNTLSIRIPVPDRVIVFGGGHVARALIPVLKNINFSCTVMEDREEFADKDKLKDAKEIILGDYKKIDEYIEIKPEDYIVVMTTGHANDFEVLNQVLRKEYAYVGAIGSRKKKAIVNEQLKEAGIEESRINEIHAPIGLSIGAVTPEEIAISVAAELISIRAQRRGKTGEK